MGVFIKGMEMPDTCYNCPCSFNIMWCLVSPDESKGEGYKENIDFSRRPDWCPLVELPENHGRLIDHAEKIPSEEPERKKGKWIATNEFDDCCYAKCNQCNVTQVFYYGKPLTKFCPNCGCDMRGEEDE